MEYTIDKTNIRELIKQEVSKLASNAIDQQGEHLYDGINIYRSDEDLVNRLIEDSVSNILARFQDCASRTGDKITFNLPDLAEVSEAEASKEITRYLSMFPVAGWCQDRLLPKAELYLTRAAASLETLVVLLRTRKRPSRHIDYGDND